MRRLGAELGVEAMALYKHVSNKEEILDGILALVVSEIEIPREGEDWKDAMRRRAISARAVLSRHAWAIGLLESRGSMGPAAMRYVDAIVGNLRSAGFSIENAAHAFWLLDSYVYGHVVQETSLPFSSSEEMTESGGSPIEQAGKSEYPHLVEMATHAQGFDYSVDGEFDFGLELILEALAELVDVAT
jgi:AcrR family transcriptional regulator